MSPCEHCANPHKEFYRHQCMYLGPNRPCEDDARKLRDRLDQQFAALALTLFAIVVATASYFLHH